MSLCRTLWNWKKRSALYNHSLLPRIFCTLQPMVEFNILYCSDRIYSTGKPSLTVTGGIRGKDALPCQLSGEGFGP